MRSGDEEMRKQEEPGVDQYGFRHRNFCFKDELLLPHQEAGDQNTVTKTLSHQV